MKFFDSSHTKFAASGRRISGRLIVAIALVLGTTAFVAPGAKLLFRAPPDPLRVIAFGSSSTEGVGATNPSAAYPAQLQQILSRMAPNGRAVVVENHGVGGEDADDMIKRLRRDVISRKPDVVIWQTGSNDPMRHVPIDRFERETRDGVVAMRAAGIGIILMEPQWSPVIEKTGRSAAYREVIRRIGRDENIDVVRRFDLMHAWIQDGLLTRTQMMAPDGLHMTDGGYRMLARSVAPTVLKVDESTPAPSNAPR